MTFYLFLFSALAYFIDLSILCLDAKYPKIKSGKKLLRALDFLNAFPGTPEKLKAHSPTRRPAFPDVAIALFLVECDFEF